ncbi:MAG: ABC transporter substrate-binding protein, partial [Anaerolineae bacterium]|nr:ABC transporter substrate-binding protein [Anaerolineae bacterium]
MMKRMLLAFVLIVTSTMVMMPAAHAQSDLVEIAVVAVEASQPALDAWVTAFQAMQPDASFAITYVATDDDVDAQIAAADMIVTGRYAADPPIEFECGVISRAYVLLPEIGARYLAGEDCGDVVSAKTPVMRDFLQFAVSPDGQQIAIDLGLLPDVVEVTDQGGVTVAVPQPVRNIVSAYGVATYYVYSVGAGDRLAAGSYVGVKGPAAQDAMRRVDPNFDTVFNAVSALSQNEINLEEAAALDPGLILTSARTQWIDSAAELGVPILRFEGESPDLLKDAMTLVGTALGPDAAYQAAQFNAYYDATLAKIAAQVATVDATPRVYFSGTNPLRTASRDMYQTAMIAAAGGESVSAELTGYWNDVNLEQVALWEPDVIFVPTYGGATVEAITEADEWQILTAVQNGAVYQLPTFISPWDTPLPDSILGIIWMAETLYPDQIDLNC